MTTHLKRPLTDHARLSVAPMMEWTDRHCRVFHRLLSRETLLYTEMVTAPAVINGDRERLLGYDPSEHPVAVQLGGSEPELLAEATRICAGFGYDEINLNCGCPSDRVQSGAFGAVLMKTPDLVAHCVEGMREASAVEVTVKCRIGVDEQEPRDILPGFIETVASAGVTRFTIHARKAWLKGLSPKENRDIPPLDYDLVHEIKAARPDLHISINGGITTLDEAEEQLAKGLDGVMIGRSAYHTPADVLCQADRRIYGDGADSDPFEVVGQMLPYIEAHIANGGRLNQITRHMLGLFAGRAGARGWRRYLSENAHKDGANTEVVEAALDYVQRG